MQFFSFRCALSNSRRRAGLKISSSFIFSYQPNRPECRLFVFYQLSRPRLVNSQVHRDKLLEKRQLPQPETVSFMARILSPSANRRFCSLNLICISAKNQKCSRGQIVNVGISAQVRLGVKGGFKVARSQEYSVNVIQKTEEEAAIRALAKLFGFASCENRQSCLIEIPRALFKLNVPRLSWR